jgi:hypothetical protein
MPQAENSEEAGCLPNSYEAVLTVLYTSFTTYIYFSFYYDLIYIYVSVMLCFPDIKLRHLFHLGCDMFIQKHCTKIISMKDGPGIIFLKEKQFIYKMRTGVVQIAMTVTASE